MSGSRVRRHETSMSKEAKQVISRNTSFDQKQDTEKGSEHTNSLRKKEKGLEEKENENKVQLKNGTIHTEDILLRILNRLERLEQARETMIEGLANRS